MQQPVSEYVRPAYATPPYATTAANRRNALIGLAVYLLLILVPAGLKLAGLTRLASWSWWWALLALWLPWALVVLGFCCVLAVRLWKGGRK